MASLIKRYLATTTSSFLINRPATTRSMATIISIPPQEGQALTVEGPTRYYTFNSRTVHPFQTAGEFHYLKVDDVVMQRSRFKLVRAAMPGVEEKGCRYWVENDNVVHFEGIAEDENQKEKPREYVGRVEFSPAVISGLKLSHFRQKLPASSITNRFLHVTRPTPTSTNIPVGGSSDDDEDADDPELMNSAVGLLTFKGPPGFFEGYNNILQRGGQMKPLSVDETEEGMVLRITMPGVEEEGCKILMKERNVVQIVAEAAKGLEQPLEPRKYSLSLEFGPEMHRAEDLQANVKNGIMKIFVPKVRKDGPNKKVENEEDRRVVPYVFKGKA